VPRDAWCLPALPRAENEFSKTGFQRAVTTSSFPPVIPPEARTYLETTSAVTT